MSEMHVDIVTPEREVFTGPVLEVRAPGWEGEFDALPGHDLYLTLLRGGLVVLVTAQGEKRFIIGRGFAEIGADRVTLLTDSCVPAVDIDKSAASKDLNEVEASMVHTAYGTAEWELAEEKRELALARLQA